MNESAFHLLFDLAQREPLGLISIVVGIPLLVLFLIVATIVVRIHPVAVWLVLAGALFGFSQLFPENRNQRASIGLIGGVMCAVVVWGWFWSAAPELREKFPRRRRRPE